MSSEELKRVARLADVINELKFCKEQLADELKQGKNETTNHYILLTVNDHEVLLNTEMALFDAILPLLTSELRDILNRLD